MFGIKVAKQLALPNLSGNMVTITLIVVRFIMKLEYINAISGGVLELKKLGFKTVTFSKTFPLEATKAKKKRFTVLNDENPLCVRLLEILSTDNVVKDSFETDDSALILKVDKPTTINDAFFSVGYIIISK